MLAEALGELASAAELERASRSRLAEAEDKILQRGWAEREVLEAWRAGRDLAAQAEALRERAEDRLQGALVQGIELMELRLLLVERLQARLAAAERAGDRAGAERLVRRLAAHLEVLPARPEASPPRRGSSDELARRRSAASPLVGRRLVLSQVAEALETGGRLVTLTGAPGIGKTRLALEIGARERQRFAGGVVFCELRQIREQGAAYHALGRALELEGGQVGALDRLAYAVSVRGPTLVVLDGAEQLQSEAVAGLLQAIPELRLLATSRAALGSAEERAIALPALSPLEALELFTAAARRVRPDFEIAPERWAVVGEVLEQLDRLPLALELAAGRLGAMTLSELAARLRRRQPLQHGAGRSLEAELRWYWELQAPWGQAALTQCAAFAGGFDLPAAEAVIALPEWPESSVADALSALVRGGLLQRVERGDGAARYQLLHTVRAFAEAALERSPMRPAVVRRHAAWYQRLGTPEALAELEGPASAEAWRALGLELENLSRAAALGEGESAARCGRAALAWFRHRGPFEQGAALAAALLERAESPADKATFALQRGVFLRLSGAPLPAADALEAARAHGERSGDAGILARIGGEQGNLLKAQGRRADALSVYREALAQARAAGVRSAEASVLGDLGELEVATGHPEPAMEHLEGALALHRALQNRRAEGVTLGSLGNLYRQLQQLDKADACYQEAAAIFRGLGARLAEATILGNRSRLLWQRGELARARERCEEALARYRQSGDRLNEVRALNVYFAILRGLGERGEAMEVTKRVIALSERFGERVTEGLGWSNRALLEREGGALEEAAASYRRALRLLQGRAHPTNLGTIHLSLAGVLQELGALAEAREIYAEAEPHLQGSGDRVLGVFWFNRWELEHLDGAQSEALGCLQRAEEHFLAAGDRGGQGLVAGGRADICVARADLEAAEALLREGEALLKSDPVERGKLLAKRGQIYRRRGQVALARGVAADLETLVRDNDLAAGSEPARSLRALQAWLQGA